MPTLDPALVGRFRLEQVDGWLEETYLSDLLDEDSVLELRPSGVGRFWFGELEGTIRPLRGTTARVLKFRWTLDDFDRGHTGTGSLAQLFPDHLSGSFKLRGERRWDFEAHREGAPDVTEQWFQEQIAALQARPAGPSPGPAAC